MSSKGDSMEPPLPPLYPPLNVIVAVYEYFYCDAPCKRMASNDTILEYDFVKKPSKDYFCPVTFDLLTDPQQTSSCCGHHLSRAAADRLKREGDACPLCSDWSLKTTDDPAPGYGPQGSL